tara:strand:- start:385 stop:744 length:360 start_codon:yes stop_codon:yes gene_type:complete
MGWFDDVGSFFKKDVGGFFEDAGKRIVGAGIGAGVGMGAIDPNSLKKGSIRVPKTKKYLLHEGEMVVPKKQATILRRNLLAEKKRKAPPAPKPKKKKAKKQPVRTLPVKKPKGKKNKKN